MNIDESFSGNSSNLPNNNNITTVIPGPLEVNGVVRAKAFMQFSDARLKTNISDIVDAIQIVTSLQGKTYQWKKEALIGASIPDSDTDNDSTGSGVSEETVGTPGAKKVIGLIAQEVQRVLPEGISDFLFTNLQM